MIASILIAFAIDAWWDDRSDRKAERALLERLHADFSALRPELVDVATEHRGRQAACLELLGRFSVGDMLPETPEVDLLVGLAFIGSRTFQPGTGSSDAFINGEGSRLVRNTRLADLILEWSGRVEELREEEQRLLATATERWTPFLASRTNLAPYIAAFGDYDPGLAQLPERQWNAAARIPLTVDQQFLNHVLERFTYQVLAVRDIEPVQAAVDEILALIETELDRSRE